LYTKNQIMETSRKLVFATRNKYKIEEIAVAAGPGFDIISMAEVGCTDDLPETSFTTAGNAIQKAHYFYERYHMNCIADDTSLEIEALEGRPGIYSARYAGLQRSYDDNVNKVLEEMQGKTNRKAMFRTVIGLIQNGEHHLFEGLVEGTIITEKRGTNGFGYDPVFLPNGSDKTYAEMDMEEKNIKSHRAIALKKLLDFLNKL
jgi:XTP/dITP diphosphohydrolase